MTLLEILILAVACLLAVILLTSYLTFRMGFYVDRKKKKSSEEEDLPAGEIYEVYWDAMRAWLRETRETPHEVFTIRSFDGLTLQGKYYEYAPGAPIELMFHGYRGSAERDLCGGMQRCFRLGHSALIVDQRCSSASGGNVITFGVKEHRDCLAWVRFAVDHFGPDCKLILTGISMGASTVLMAGGRELPENVIGILADCGFTSAKEIICEVIRKMKMPPKLVYPCVKLGARIFGHFDLEEWPAVEAMEHCKVPVIFFHGEADDFVPCWMSRKNFEACVSRKKLILVPGAGHGLSYPAAQEEYIAQARKFFH